MEKNKFDWNLEAILNGQSFDTLYLQWKEKNNEYIKIYKNSFETKKKFIKYHQLIDDIEKLNNIISNYIYNNLNINAIDVKWNSLAQTFSYDTESFDTKTSDMSNIILKNKLNIYNYLKDQNLIKYKKIYDLFFRYEKHILSDEVELAISKISINNGSINDIYNTFLDSDLIFDDATNSEGKKIKINTISDVYLNLKSDDRKLRKTSWISCNNSYYTYRNTLTKTLYYNYLKLNTWSKLRNFDDYIDSTVKNDEVSKEFILNLYNHIESFKNCYSSFKQIKNKLLKKQLNVSKLYPWDKKMELLSTPEKFSIQQAKEEVINALKPLGEKYIKIINRIFEEQWISWLPKKNKHSGAYSIGGIKGLNQYYILMNFIGTSNCVSTLIHELGHSMNSYFSVQKQEVFPECSIFYAEISSIVNEVLLSLYWIEKYKNNKVKRKNVICNLLNNFFATTTRQIIFSNFEYIINEKINNKETITYEVIESVYQQMLEKYDCLNENQLKEIKNKDNFKNLSSILTVPHFYVGNFYVYKYAIGQIVALYIGYKIFNNDKTTIEQYYSFLSSGSSLSPIETIELLGVDLKNNYLYDEVKKIINNLIHDFNN